VRRCNHGHAAGAARLPGALVDRAKFPSDTLSTHVIHAPGVAALDRWGLLDTVLATGCPPIEHYSFDFGPIVIDGITRPVDGLTTAYAPRRTVLDRILVNAAAAAGATIREEFNVDDLIFQDGTVCGIRGHFRQGKQESLTARIVIGADGCGSHVAKVVRARSYQETPRLQWPFYTYFSELPVDGFETYIRPFRGFAAAATNDGLTMLVVGWPSPRRAPTRPMSRPLLPHTGSRPGICGARQVGEARGTVPRRCRTQLPARSVRPRLGAGRRRRLYQGPDHRTGDHRRVS
jgi:2-polyprenyl-6-methoxyphenol hydroxylase-like FAD-dependent oxidoreductase